MNKISPPAIPKVSYLGTQLDLVQLRKTGPAKHTSSGTIHHYYYYLLLFVVYASQVRHVNLHNADFLAIRNCTVSLLKHKMHQYL